MSWLQFDQYGVWINVVLFLVAAVLVWGAGTRLTGYLDVITDRTGMDKAFAGMLFLGGATSLPEIAAITTAAATANAPLATNNLLGSVAINVMLIAVADAALGRDALTSVVPSSTTILQGTMGMIMLALLAVAILVGDVQLVGVGLWPLVLATLCVGAFWLASRYAARAPWRADHRADAGGRGQGREFGSESQQGMWTLAGKTAGAVCMVLIAGFVLSQSADALSKATGIGAGLMGLVVVGFATSLPELSSITAAVRRHQYEMALGDVFGTNLLTISLILLVDVIYPGGPVLAQAGRFEAVAALLGAILTGLFVVGLLERRNRTILRMGYDALAGIVVFAGGLVLLYSLQSG
jgi:cation:H+ antiporter